MIMTSKSQVAAPPERVIAALADVQHWPEWTESVTSVQRLEPGPLAVGSRTRIKQPKLRESVWQVTEIDDRAFSWESRSPGIVTTGRHQVEPDGDGTTVTLSIEHAGVLSGVVGAMTKGLTMRYLEMEGAGLQRFCTG